eukprot:2312039-Amphidinium_carterae.1
MRTGMLADNLHSSINFIQSFLPLAPCCQHLYSVLYTMAATQEVTIAAAQVAVVEESSNVAATGEVVAASVVIQRLLQMRKGLSSLTTMGGSEPYGLFRRLTATGPGQKRLRMLR